MAAALSPLSAFSTSFQRMSALLLWLLLLLAPVDAQNQTDEVQTLLRFKELMEVDTSSLARVYWRTWKETDKTPCNWWGVICTRSFTVEQIDLSKWGLTRLSGLGVLSNLTDLRVLDLSVNNLRSSQGIQDDIGSLIGLTYLDLLSTGFSGSIPRNISACRNLRHIDLGWNALTGEIPDLSGLVNLQFLSFEGNQLSGPFPKWLGQLNNLLVIELSYNMLSGTIPSVPNLTTLVSLALDGNHFTGFEEPMFPDAKGLESLSVTSNQLKGPIPASITKFSNLTDLVLAGNQLSGHIPSGFSLNMSNANTIDLSQNQLTGNIPESLLQPSSGSGLFMSFTDGPSLILSGNLLTGTIPFDGTKQYYYDILDFSNNNLSGPIPSICNNGTTYVNRLYLQNNILAGDIVDFLRDCNEHIQTMVLANNSLSGDLSRLAHTSTSSDFVMREGNLIRDFNNNNFRMSITEANPDPLMAVLEFFVLNNSVNEFHMQGNNFSAVALPKYFPSSANALQVLDLSNNHLIGEISDAAFNSTWLPALEFLYLSNNYITGPIPDAILMLPNLAVLDVSNNSLSGRLPAILPDKLYNPSFFAGNYRLCGGPSQHTCPNSTSVKWWLLLITIGGSIFIAMGSCLIVTWRWRRYQKMHQQDSDLIKTLLEKESAALMPLRELKKATNNFAESAQIGAGGFGTVYTGKLTDGTVVAIKRSKREGSEKDKDQFLNEVRILSQVNHRHLVKLLGCCMENKIALLVFEFVSNGTLQEHLQGKIGVVPLSWKHRLGIAVQTADALNYLHSAATFPIYHRDVKSSNILLNDDLHAKVADFGISKLAPLEATHVSTMAVQGTIGYIDPEYYTSYQLTDKSDVYSFGVVLLELISAKHAIDFLRGGEQTSLVNFANPHIQSGDLGHFLDPSLIETYNDLAGHGRESILNVGRLALKCLHLQSKGRPSMNDVWKELQKLWHELNGSSQGLGSIKEDDNDNPQHGHIALLSNAFSCNSSSFIICKDSTSIQMSQFSHP